MEYESIGRAPSTGRRDRRDIVVWSQIVKPICRPRENAATIWRLMDLESIID